MYLTGCNIGIDAVRQSAGVGRSRDRVLVETLLDRAAESDVAEAEAAVERLAAAPTDDGFPPRDILVLRLRALLARACGDDVVYRKSVACYRAMAKSLGFYGHIAMAEAMWRTSGQAATPCVRG
jgi:hypothetical protein